MQGELAVALRPLPLRRQKTAPCDVLLVPSSGEKNNARRRRMRNVWCSAHPWRSVTPASCGSSAEAREARGNRSRRVSAVRRLLPLSRSPGERKGTLLAIRWVDVAGRTIRRQWISRLPQSIGGGGFPHPEAGETAPSSSTRTPRSSPSALELERTASAAMPGGVPDACACTTTRVAPALTSLLRLNEEMEV
jgi:hypothetical protein